MAHLGFRVLHMYPNSAMLALPVCAVVRPQKHRLWSPLQLPSCMFVSLSQLRIS